MGRRACMVGTSSTLPRRCTSLRKLKVRYMCCLDGSTSAGSAEKLEHILGRFRARKRRGEGGGIGKVNKLAQYNIFSSDFDIRTRIGLIAARHAHVCWWRASVLSSVDFWRAWEFYWRGCGDRGGSPPAVKGCFSARRVLRPVCSYFGWYDMINVKGIGI